MHFMFYFFYILFYFFFFLNKILAFLVLYCIIFFFIVFPFTFFINFARWHNRFGFKFPILEKIIISIHAKTGLNIRLIEPSFLNDDINIKKFYLAFVLLFISFGSRFIFFLLRPLVFLKFNFYDFDLIFISNYLWFVANQTFPFFIVFMLFPYVKYFLKKRKELTSFTIYKYLSIVTIYLVISFSLVCIYKCLITYFALFMVILFYMI